MKFLIFATLPSGTDRIYLAYADSEDEAIRQFVADLRVSDAREMQTVEVFSVGAGKTVPISL